MRWLISFPRWLLLVLLVEAPWLYGTTRDWTIQLFDALLWLLIVSWIFGFVLRRLKPRLPHWALWISCALMVQGAFLAWNAHFAYDPSQLEFMKVVSPWPSGPGGVDRLNSIPILLRVAGLLGVVLFCCDLFQRPIWRRRVEWTIGLTGISLLAVGLLRECFGYKLVSDMSGVVGPTSFGPYYYHANAGAYINLVLPLILGLALRSFRHREYSNQRGLWVPGLLLCLAAAVTAASKAAMVVTGLILIASFAWWVPRWLRGRQSLSPRRLAIASAVVAVCFVIAGSVGWEIAQRQWSEFPSSFGIESVQAVMDLRTIQNVPGHRHSSIVPWWENGRWMMYEICVAIIPETGPWGVGPGNFGISYRTFAQRLGIKTKGSWEFAHNDYLQAVIEWGWIGAAAWGILLVGTLGCGVRAYRRAASYFEPADRTLLFASIVALAGVLAHAAVDFPLQIASLEFYAAVYAGLALASRYWAARPVQRTKRTRSTQLSPS